MDFALYARVLGRFWLLIAAGLVAACVLALLTVARVELGGVPHLALREKPSYKSQSTLLITQPGFPLGSAVQPYVAPQGDKPAIPVGDLSRLIALTNVYIAFANGDGVRHLMPKGSGAAGTVSAAPLYGTLPTAYQSSNLPPQLPSMIITASGDSPAAAVTTAQAWIRAFRSYIRQQQESARIATSQRIILQTLNAPGAASKVGGPNATLAVVVFLAVMMAVVGLAFLLENLRPRRHLVAVEAEAQDRLSSSAAPRT